MTGLQWNPDLFEENLKGSAAALQGYYDYMRKNDLRLLYGIAATGSSSAGAISAGRVLLYLRCG